MTFEEEKLIAETPITVECFEMSNFDSYICADMAHLCTVNIWESLIDNLEALRKAYLKTKDKRYLNELIRLLPNTYKVVKL